ncbi:MAG TPA: hypothetical protein VHU80_21815 [Polyangiaceae bacterium]|nr:hypothetical protein [Polyangiaceae bacterium]
MALLSVTPAVSWAGESTACRAAHVSVDGELDTDWRESVERLCEELSTMTDVDSSALLNIVQAGHDVQVKVTLVGGRTALRVVHSPDDLLTIVEALTVALPPARSAPTPASPAVNAAPPNSRLPPAPDARGSAVTAAATTPARNRSTEAGGVGVELGFALEGRLSGAPAYISLGAAAYAGIRPGPWFLGVVARWQPSEALASGSEPDLEMESAGAGFVVAHRVLRSHLIGLDMGASALVLVDTQSTESRTPDEVGSSTDVRFGLLLRALVGTSSWKFSPSLDADLAPARVRHAVRLDAALPSLPEWSVALELGTSWVEP